jgi:hypothetical protein
LLAGSAGLAAFVAIAIVSSGVVAVADSGPAYQLNAQGTLITGQAGKVLRVTAAPATAADPVARVCYEITNNTFYVMVTEMTEVPVSDICGGTMAIAMLPPGDYIVTAGVYPAGSQVPDKETHLPVTIYTSDRFATIDGAALSQVSLGDANCDGALNGLDLADVLRGAASIFPAAPCLEAANVLCLNPMYAADALAIAKWMAGLTVDLGGCPAFLDAPALVSPNDGEVFDVFPRNTSVSWQPVAGAVEYAVYLDGYGCGVVWCSDLGWGYRASHLPGTSTVVTSGGSGPYRWRVAAIGADGRAGPFSEWRGFRYLR